MREELGSRSGGEGIVIWWYAVGTEPIESIFWMLFHVDVVEANIDAGVFVLDVYSTLSDGISMLEFRFLERRS